MSSRLADSVALVTGAGSGIGRGVTERFVAEGARVVALDRSEQNLRQLERELGSDVAVTVGDVRSPTASEEAVALAVERFGGLDTLVANAGVFDGMLSLDELEPEMLLEAGREIFDINVLGYLLSARASVEQLRRRRGSMVFTVSNSGLHAGTGGGVLYASSKHAVVGLVRQLAHELAPEIRVNGVAPGGTITDLQVTPSLSGLVENSAHFADEPGAAAAISETNPLRLVPDVSDHASLFVLLASRDARAMTGEVISNDGGLAVRGLDLRREPEG